jgi:hypothetical protein
MSKLAAMEGYKQYRGEMGMGVRANYLEHAHTCMLLQWQLLSHLSLHGCNKLVAIRNIRQNEAI